MKNKAVSLFLMLLMGSLYFYLGYLKGLEDAPNIVIQNSYIRGNDRVPTINIEEGITDLSGFEGWTLMKNITAGAIGLGNSHKKENVNRKGPPSETY